LVPFVEECLKLDIEGFLFGNEVLPKKVFALLLYADSPARVIVRDAKQFNGQFGCDWCEFEGVALVSNGGLPVQYYTHRTLVM
jgi:hypothetical protein